MRRPLLLAALIATAAVVPSAASAATFTYGVAAGEVTSSSALLWGHLEKSGVATVTVARDARFKRVVARAKARASSSADRTLNAAVAGLPAYTRLFYRWSFGRAHSATGAFLTAPSPRSAKTIRFAWSGDADAQRAKGSKTPFYNTLGDRNFAVYRAMVREHNAFNVNLGDTIYSDSEVGSQFVNGQYRGFGPALTRRAKWAKYRQNIALPNLQAIREASGFYSHPDDHEWINDFTRSNDLTGTNPKTGKPFRVDGRKIYMPGVQAFRDWAPVRWSKPTGFYRVFHWGKNLDVFFLDERSFRSPKAGDDYIHTCDNPQTGKPDLAPTAPADKRALFSLAVPSFKSPPPPACLATINSPKRTFLGKRQLSLFLKQVKASKATFKVIMNEVPINRLYILPYDEWDGYEAERRTVLNYLRKNVKNSVFLTTDHHANLAGTAKITTFKSEGGTDDTGIYDIATGPVATMTYKREINGATGEDPGTGKNAGIADSVFLTPPPDAGLGLQCSALDVFSYGEVTVTAKKLTVQLKDLHGKPVREEEGNKPACPTFTIPAK